MVRTEGAILGTPNEMAAIQGVNIPAKEQLKFYDVWGSDWRAPSTRTTQYFEMVGNRALYHDGWTASTTPPEPPWDLGLRKFPNVVNGYKWELYNLASDYSQRNNLASKMPDTLRALQEQFLGEATKYNVFSLDNSLTARVATAASKRDRRPNRVYVLGGIVGSTLQRRA